MPDRVDVRRWLADVGTAAADEAADEAAAWAGDSDGAGAPDAAEAAGPESSTAPERMSIAADPLDEALRISGGGRAATTTRAGSTTAAAPLSATAEGTVSGACTGGGAGSAFAALVMLACKKLSVGSEAESGVAAILFPKTKTFLCQEKIN
jgi:hypothetical protein